MKTVLIVEDESIVALDMRFKMLDEGYHVVDVVSTAEAAIEAAAAHRPDLILMDIKLAGEMDGVQAAQQILQAQPECVIIFMTAYSDNLMVQRMNATAAAGYIVKPFFIGNLRQMLAKTKLRPE